MLFHFLCIPVDRFAFFTVGHSDVQIGIISWPKLPCLRLLMSPDFPGWFHTQPISSPPTTNPRIAKCKHFLSSEGHYDLDCTDRVEMRQRTCDKRVHAKASVHSKNVFPSPVYRYDRNAYWRQFGMLSPWTVAQLVAEAGLPILHVGLAVFITVQVKNRIVMFRNAFYYIYLLLSFADVGDYAMVSSAYRLTGQGNKDDNEKPPVEQRWKSEENHQIHEHVNKMHVFMSMR